MEITTLNNNKMGTQILKQGDFTLTHFAYCDVYVIFYKDNHKWAGLFNELENDELRFYIFEIEPNGNKAAEFIVKLYDWLSSQEEAFEELLVLFPDEAYEEEEQSKDTKKITL